MKHEGGRGRGVLRAVMVVVMLGASLYTLAGGTAAADPLIAQTPIPKTQPRIGRSNAQATVPLTVALKPVDDNALNGFLAQLSNPQSPQYRKFLTPRQFTDRFFASADRAQVVNFLMGKGLTVTDTGMGTLVDASGSVADVERAFNVTLSDYRDTDGRVFRAADRTPALPSSVAAKITDVTGLDNSVQPHSRVARKPALTPAGSGATPRVQSPRTATGCTAAVNTATRYSGYTPNQIATAYNFDALYIPDYKGQGESIALFEFDDYVDENVVAFQNCFGSSVDVRRLPVDGGAVLGQASGQIEVELDIDVIVGLAPQLSHLYVYSSPTDAANLEELRQYQRIANDNLASVVSTSWGNCEQEVTSSFRNTENTIFRQMAAEGQTFFDAIGDTGSQECLAVSGYTGIVADSIGSQPWVTGVGGTTLTINDTTNAYMSETVWNDFARPTGSGATGGGISQFWPRPDWQTGPGVNNAYSNGKRQSPDVAANADPFVGYITYTVDAAGCPVYTGDSSATTCYTIIGGTSAGAPLWAAATALTNQVLTANGTGRLGFANPTIYALFRAQPTLFHDVTQGDNCYSDACVVPGSAPGNGTGTYPATVGYDMTTGVGTLDAGRFVQAVFGGRPAITAMDIDAGPTDGGTRVTLTGSGFGTGMTVTFGDAPATFTLVSFTQIVATAPPHVSAEVPITVTGANGLTATAPHTYAYVNRAPPMHPTAPVPTPRQPRGDTPATSVPPPTAAPHVTVPDSGRGSPGTVLPHPAAPTVLPATGTPLPAPARH